MKIKIKELSYEKVMALPNAKHKKPIRPKRIFRFLLKYVSKSDLKATNFKYEKIGMENKKKNEPVLYLMNHSSFIDLKIAGTIIYPEPFNIVCTADALIGKEWLMRNLGCIPTNKYVTDISLVKDMEYALHKLKSSVLLYPEAGYSFDGLKTTLPDSIPRLIKLLKVPVVMIKTEGAYLRDPLYNNLQLRKVNVKAVVKYLLSKEDIETKSKEEISALIDEQFAFDNFLLQQNNKVVVSETFRADGLNRVLYKCPHCLEEGQMVGKGIEISCSSCGVRYELDEQGYLVNENAKYKHIPDWFNWEREEVKKEILAGSYALDTEVDIYILKDTKALYKVGNGHLHHDIDGFVLSGCDGKLNYRQSSTFSYGLNVDYFWYEIGDVIGIGDKEALYYCFPKNKEINVAKTRLAAEEIYKLKKAKQKN